MYAYINDILTPPEILIDEEIISEFDAIKETETELLPIEFTHKTLVWAVQNSCKIRNSIHYQKKAIDLTPKHKINRIENCTDDALIQIKLLEATKMLSYARFQGNHASVVVDDGPHYWQVDNDLTIGLKNSSMKEPHIDEEKIIATERALNEMRMKKSVGCYIFMNQFNNWEHQIINEGQGIRKSSPYTDRDDLLPQKCFVLVRPPLGILMLSAIDIADNINMAVKDKQDSTARSLLIPKLKPYIPKLK